jgi:exopolysaccharide production protein ExoZ
LGSFHSPLRKQVSKSLPPDSVSRADDQQRSSFRKNDALQVLRAVAALLVVYAHSIDLVDLHQRPRQAHFYYLENFGACGVDIFFAISGFILATVILRTRQETPGKALDFLTRRFIRILPIYWIVSLLPLVFAAKHHFLTPGLVLNSYLLLPSLHYPMQEPLISIGWTLIFEIFFYYVLSFNLLFGKAAVIPRAIFSILILIGLGPIADFQRPVLILIANPMNIEFVLGCCIALLYAKFGGRPALGTAFIVIGGLALGMTIFFGYGNIDDSGLILNGHESWYRVARWGLASATLTAGFVFRPAEIRSAFGKLWVYLGDASYLIYLTSVITLFLCNRGYHFVAGFPPDLNIFLALSLVALVGSATYSLVERPITQYISKRYQQTRMVHQPVG